MLFRHFLFQISDLFYLGETLTSELALKYGLVTKVLITTGDQFQEDLTSYCKNISTQSSQVRVFNLPKILFVLGNASGAKYGPIIEKLLYILGNITVVSGKSTLKEFRA